MSCHLNAEKDDSYDRRQRCIYCRSHYFSYACSHRVAVDDYRFNHNDENFL